MFYGNLQNRLKEQKINVGVIGATKGYGYTLLAQLRSVAQIHLRVICSRHIDDCRNVLEETGYPLDRIKEVRNSDDMHSVKEDDIVIVEDYKLALQSGISAIVECTGNVELGAEISKSALEQGIDVYMVSKETDSVCGTQLRQIAASKGVIYTLANGDQPKNLIDLFSWARILGLEVVAAGKSSEYDLVWDNETHKLCYLDGSNRCINLPELKTAWKYDGMKTLANRQELLSDFMDIISADLCEMNLVANVTGLAPAAPHLNYPIVRIEELADVFCPVDDGGILETTGVVDVFYNLREKHEASFAGGEFIIVKCRNSSMWEILEEKGHVVSKNRKYACIYLPYHMMGLETPITILLGSLLRIGNMDETRQSTIMGGIAKHDLPTGTKFTVSGHHHSIEGLTPTLLPAKQYPNAVPFYLLNQISLSQGVKAGEVLTLSDVSLPQSLAFDLYQAGLRLTLNEG